MPSIRDISDYPRFAGNIALYISQKKLNADYPRFAGNIAVMTAPVRSRPDYPRFAGNILSVINTFLRFRCDFVSHLQNFDHPIKTARFQLMECAQCRL